MTRKELIIENMKLNNLTQMIVSDKMSIFYITGKKIEPGERLNALYININGDFKLIINRLFPQKQETGLEYIWYSDDEDGIQILSQIIDRNLALGIDKNWTAGFLLKLSKYIGNFNFIDSSYIIDNIRLIKDDNEQALMKESSRLNDLAMSKILLYIKEGIKEIELYNKVKAIYNEIGFEDVSFEPIISFGKNAANPHHNSDNTILKKGDCILIDIGRKKGKLLFRYDKNSIF